MNNKPSSLKKDIEEVLSDVYMMGWHATAPDLNSEEVSQAHTQIINLIESVIPEKKDLSEFPEKVTSTWIQQYPHAASKLGNLNGYNQAIKDIKSKLIDGGESNDSQD